MLDGPFVMPPSWSTGARAALAGLTALVAIHCSSGDDAPAPSDTTTDNHPGSLVITSPARAAFIEQTNAPIDVTGTGATPALTIDGAPAQVAPDGSFHATVKPVVGLNLIEAVDQDSHLETPFLYGHFRKATDAVDHGVAVDLGANGMAGAAKAPETNMSALVNQALTDVDLLASVKGQTLSGSAPANGSWKYKVTGGKYSGVTVALTPRAGGVHATVVVKNVEIDGTLTVSYYGASHSGPVTMTASAANVVGDLDLALATSGIDAKMPSATTTLDGFKYDSGNSGLPCCVDDAMTNYLKPKVEAALHDQVQKQVPASVSGALGGLKIASTIDLSAAGVTPPVAMNAHVDGVDFDPAGGSLTAALLFGTSFSGDQPGTKAPGWLELGAAAPSNDHKAPMALSVSFDTVNQVFFTVWGSGALKRTLPDASLITSIQLDPKLPPLLLAASDGTLEVALSELVFQAKLHETPFTAAVTIVQGVAPRLDATNGTNLVLDPKGDPKLSITWLAADGLPDGTRSLIEAAAKDQLTHVLKPVAIPLPTMALDRLGTAFTGKALALNSPALAVDAPGARIGISGGMLLQGK